MIHLQEFTRGLWLASPEDQMPQGTMRRARGIHPLATGAFRSRNGSLLLHSLDAHSLFYFGDVWYSGVTTSIYRAAVEIVTGQDGERLSFMRMPPTAGIVDYLFVCGGAALWKIDSSGNETPWGIDIPASLSGAASNGGSLPVGTYLYQITYKNSTTGTRSNGNGTDISVTTSGSDLTAVLTLPTPSDGQIDKIEIWRTVEGGAALFYLAEVAHDAGTYADDGSDSLSSIALPTTNVIPYSWFEDCLGPINASVFWLTRTEAGERGRIYYSPVGRAEAVEGFIEVTNDDDPLQKLISWQGMLGVLSESRMFQIIGTNPYIAREVSGAPGTTAPHTVKTTPYGILYEASDGVRLFNGSVADLVAPDAIVRLFRGDSVENLSSFTGVVAAYARHEYIISDGSQTLALNLRDKKWRDLGVGLDAMHYAEEADILGVTLGAAIVDFEKEGQVTDNGTDIPLDIEPPHIRGAGEGDELIRHIHIDANTGDEALTVQIILDGTLTTLGQLRTASRAITTFNIGLTGHVVGVRISGDVGAAVEIFKISVDNAPVGAEA